MRSCAVGVVGLVATGLVAAGPAAPKMLAGIDTAGPDVQLTAAGFEDLANISLNLFYDIINIPANELKAIDEFALSQFFSGPWFVSSGLNLWGIDLGDAPRIEALVDMLLPIPALSKPLGQQLAGYLEAELPSNSNCDAIFCTPTGFQDLFNGFFRVPITELQAGYAFPESGPTVDDPYGAVAGALGFPGTKVAEDGADVFPWAGTTFTLDWSKPWTDFFDSLTAAPPADPLVSSPDFLQVLTDFLTSFYVMFNPFLPGGTYIPDFPWLDPDTSGLLDQLTG